MTNLIKLSEIKTLNENTIAIIDYATNQAIDKCIKAINNQIRTDVLQNPETTKIEFAITNLSLDQVKASKNLVGVSEFDKILGVDSKTVNKQINQLDLSHNPNGNQILNDILNTQMIVTMNPIKTMDHLVKNLSAHIQKEDGYQAVKATTIQVNTPAKPNGFIEFIQISLTNNKLAETNQSEINQLYSQLNNINSLDNITVNFSDNKFAQQLKSYCERLQRKEIQLEAFKNTVQAEFNKR